MTNQQLAAERLSRLEVGGVWIAKDGFVNLDDLLGALRPGQRIVRVRGDIDQVIRYEPAGGIEPVGCVAGWISDEPEEPVVAKKLSVVEKLPYFAWASGEH